VEIVSTNGANATFSFTGFSINTTQSSAVLQRPGFPAATKPPLVKNEFFSLSGKRLVLKNGAAGAVVRLDGRQVRSGIYFIKCQDSGRMMPVVLVK
jgi:hypothetical protein